MTKSLWFIVPAHGRAELARICLQQLRWTCDTLTNRGIHAEAVVIADDVNLDTADELGFATVRRDNRFTSRKFNDGIQLALDPEVNSHPADYVVPCGSDDWVHPDAIVLPPDSHTVIGFQRMVFVDEAGREMRTAHIGYPGGCGIRIYPRQLMRPLGYWPADPGRRRGCDTAILNEVRAANPGMRILHVDTDPRWIVDWKSPGQQLNTYAELRRWFRGDPADPFDTLADLYPADALDRMANHYGLVPA